MNPYDFHDTTRIALTLILILMSLFVTKELHGQMNQQIRGQLQEDGLEHLNSNRTLMNCSLPNHKLGKTPQKIPNIVHYIFGLSPDFGSKPFSFIHFLSILATRRVIRPQRIYFHYQFEPDSVWYHDYAKKYVTPIHITDDTDSVYGHKITSPAHMADVLRLKILQRYGGIYLDIDVIPLRPFEELLHNSMVMGYEGGNLWGLCNAVILAERGAPFLDKWLATYVAFDSRKWNQHSVIIPKILAEHHVDEICRLSPTAFFWPTWTSNHIAWMFEEMGTTQRIEFEQNLTKIKNDRAFDDYFSVDEYKLLFGDQFAIHLWESLTWDKYLKKMDPETLNSSTSRFAMMVKQIIKID